MKITVDGYNICLETGTGIATYARQLISQLRGLGHEVSLLTGKPVPGGLGGKLGEVAMFDTAPPWGGTARTWRGAFKVLSNRAFLTGTARARTVPLNGVVDYRVTQERFPKVDGLINAPNVFEVARVRFHALGRLLRIAPDERQDVMHWTYPVPAYLAGARNVYTIHDLIPLKTPSLTLDDKGYYYRMVKRVAEAGDTIVTGSENAKRDIVSILEVPEKKVVVIRQSVKPPPDGTGAEAGAADLVERLFGLPWRGYFLYLGAIEPRKNIRRLLEAYIAADVPLPLAVAGPLGWLVDKELQPLKSKATAAERVQMLGYVTPAQKQALLRGARALVFPSIIEGFGLPPLEAMMAGCPVICSDTSSLPEVCEEAAYYVDPFDPEALLGAMRLFAKDPGLAERYGKRGPEQAAKYSPAVYREELAEFYPPPPGPARAKRRAA